MSVMTYNQSRQQARIEALAALLNLSLPVRRQAAVAAPPLLHPSGLTCPDCAAREAEAIAKAQTVTGGPESDPTAERSRFSITTWRTCLNCGTERAGGA